MPSARSCLIAFALFVVQHAAKADDESARKEALAKFQEGIDLYRQSDLEGARIRFVEAYSVLHSGDVLWNLSITELRSGRPLDALQHLQAYLHDESVDAKSKDRAEPYFKEAYDRTGHIRLLCDSGKVAIDNGEIKDCPVRQDVDVVAGTHVIVFPETGRRLEVVCDAGQVRIVNANTTKPTMASSSPVRSGQKDDGPKWIIGGSLLGAGAVGIVSGIAFGIASRNARDEGASIFSSRPGSCDIPALVDDRCRRASDELDKANSRSTLSLVSYVSGGALLVAGAAVVALWPGANSRSAKWKVRPTVGGGAISAEF